MSHSKKYYAFMILLIVVIISEAVYIYQVTLTTKRIEISERQVKTTQTDLSKLIELKKEYANQKKLMAVQKETDDLTQKTELYELALKQANSSLSPYIDVVVSFEQQAKNDNLTTQIQTFNQLSQLSPPYPSKNEAKEAILKDIKEGN
ncbi:hypothetical protein CBF34_10240 [Vagococcus penaei]|uniref:Uncharacterized protein n=1 Tax=Vagococcus penaei TaxID=633807 RepID=A0A1Q2D336_9ENTE|nr:hypothetical protein [Vagococcus penaei]AQP52765.1 hypothetical protein BW732_00060 [Vagococcus penaei]RST98453.1 hypothetical protein CBF34_10240 [Vagococcus penaei]